MRTKDFYINFLNQNYFEQCKKNIQENQDDSDEFAAGNFTVEPAKTVVAPRIKESFLSLECQLELEKDLSQKSIASLIIGKVTALAIEENFPSQMNTYYGENGFIFNIHQPRNPITGRGDLSGLGILNIIKKY